MKTITRKCSRCGKIKPLDEFTTRMGRSLDKTHTCKECDKIIQKKFRESTKGRAAQKRYRESATGQAYRKYYAESEHGQTVLSKYSKSPKGRAIQKRYRKSAHGRTMRKKYRESPAGKIARKKYDQSAKGKLASRRNRKKYSQEIKARKILNNRIVSGKLQRGTVCAKMNKNCKGRIEGHHMDYSKPLEVIWLCKFHHLQFHTRTLKINLSDPKSECKRSNSDSGCQ